MANGQSLQYHLWEIRTKGLLQNLTNRIPTQYDEKDTHQQHCDEYPFVLSNLSFKLRRHALASYTNARIYCYNALFGTEERIKIHFEDLGSNSHQY